jgi:hypothetical protein
MVWRAQARRPALRDALRNVLPGISMREDVEHFVDDWTIE